MEITPEKALAILKGYQKRPLDWVDDVYGDELPLWGTQREIVEAVFKYRNVAVKSCNSAGKSYVAARVAHAFLTLHPHSLVVSTAPTARQVKDVLWRYIGGVHGKSKYPLGGHLTQLGLEYDKDWFGVGLSTSEPEKFFGYHADHILVIVDEASGVDEAIYKGVRAITPNENAHTLLIGNPTNPDGTFYKAFTDLNVKTFTISVFDTPNLVANNIHGVDDLIRVFTPPEGVDPIDHKPKFDFPYPALISPTAVYERFIEWGADSPWWQALMLGEFPSQAEFSLIPLNLIQQSMDPEYRREHGWQVETGELEYGLDVARFGMDKTVLAMRRGGFVEPLIAWSKTDTVMTAKRVIDNMSQDDWKAVVKVDDTGVGGGVTDRLREYLRNDTGKVFHYRVMPIDFGAGTVKPEKFYNKRAEMYWNLRELFFAHKIALPKDMELANELASIQFKPFKGKDDQVIAIESKDDIKARLGKSPDRADALVLAFANSGAGKWDLPETTRFGDVKPRMQPVTSGLLQRY